MLGADPELQHLAMLYTPAWNGFVEGPTWGAWWIQNSYGPTYCGLPFFEEPLVRFLQNAQDLWFDQMGDGKRVWKWRDQELVIPDGQLCDAASPDWYMPKQGDGRVDIHDWGIEFTAAGMVMQAELLLISRDRSALERYLPKLERSADLLESRRDPANNLFWAGPAGNLLAPSYAGWRKPDGTYGQAYLAGLSISTIAALDRLIELEKLAGRGEAATRYAQRREQARQGLARLTTEEGYFIKSLDPDGTRHGVYGAERHGYFEAVCNHDAICFRVVDDEQAERIYRKIAAIPGLRPHGFILTSCPSLDDMYTPPTSWLWQFGTWVNGGHWSTCEARMIMGYYRVGQFEDARRSMRQLLRFARAFRMDNPLVDFGAAVYQPREAINLCYDSFGPPTAMLRGLFEYLYGAEGLTLLPHIPPSIIRLEQHFPVRFGRKRLYLSTTGTGPVKTVTVNGQAWSAFDGRSVSLPYARTPEVATIQIALGGAEPAPFRPETSARPLPAVPELTGLAPVRELFPLMTSNELPLRIGADSEGGSRFVGQIARAQVFRRALSAAEVRALAVSNEATRAADATLVGEWRMEVGQDGTVRNAAGDALTGRSMGEVGWTNAAVGPALVLSGGGHLEVAHDDRLNLSNGCTLAAWICPKAQAAGGGRIIDKSQVGTANGYLLDTYPGNSLRLITEGGTLSFEAKLPVDTWVHVAATADASGRLALYVAGQEVAARDATPGGDLAGLEARLTKLRRFHERLEEAGLGEAYEAAHARLALEYAATTERRFKLKAAGRLEALPERSQRAADRSYLETTARLCEGLAKTLAGYAGLHDAQRKRLYEIWAEN